MQTVIYLAARTSGIPFVSSSLSASPSQKTSQFRTSLSPWLSPVPQVPSSIVTLFSQCANTGTRNRSLPRPHNPTAVPYTLGFVPHHARCLRKFALDVVTDAACAIRGSTDPKMPYGHIVEHSQYQGLKLPNTSRPTASSSAAVASPLDLSASDHFNPVGTHAHHRTGNEWQLLPLSSAVSGFALPGNRCVHSFARDSSRRLPYFRQTTDQAGSGLDLHFPRAQFFSLLDMGYGSRDHEQAGRTDWVGCCGHVVR
jgi:hypothetical protein